FFIIVGFIGLFFGIGIGAGYFAALVKDEPIRSYASMEKDIYNIEETSKLYFADEVYIGDVRSDLHREKVPLKEISPILIDAVIATEEDRKSTRLNSSHVSNSYAVICLKKKTYHYI